MRGFSAMDWPNSHHLLERLTRDTAANCQLTYKRTLQNCCCDWVRIINLMPDRPFCSRSLRHGHWLRKWLTTFVRSLLGPRVRLLRRL